MRTALAAMVALIVSLAVMMPRPVEAADVERRVALVIGNGAYVYAPPLPNPPNDARLIAKQLKAEGFVLVGDGPLVDLDHDAFAKALNDFSALAAGADVALFYYAGHGMQLLDTNWLVPVSANPEKPSDLPSQAIDIGDVLKRLEFSEAKFKLVLLDACRNNPFLGRGLRSVSGGLMRMDAPDGTLISYATKPGAVALDGTGADSPYSTALATLLAQPGVPVLSMFNQLGVAVMRATNKAQEPWLSTSPIETEFMFADATGPAVAPPSPSPSPSPAPAPAPLAPAVAVAPATPAVSAPAAPVAGGGAASPALPPPAAEQVQIWDWIDQPRAMPRDLDVFAGPFAGARVLTSLRQGTSVFVVGLTFGQQWVQVRLGDNVTVGYIPADRLADITAEPPPGQPSAAGEQPGEQSGAPQPGAEATGAAAQVPAYQPIYPVVVHPPPPVSGPATVHDTATLLVDDRVVPLSGIEGFGGPMVAGFEGFLAAQGGTVTCHPGDPGRYVCLTPGGVDVALAALDNGAAVAAPGAPRAYVDMQEQAAQRGAGIWAPAAPAPVDPDPLPPDADYAAGAPAPLYVLDAYADPDAGDAPDVGDAPFETDYGVAEIDGELVTVIDGQRVAIEADDHGGWAYRDRAGHVRALPAAYEHDLHAYHALHRDERPRWPASVHTAVAPNQHWSRAPERHFAENTLHQSPRLAAATRYGATGQGHYPTSPGRYPAASQTHYQTSGQAHYPGSTQAHYPGSSPARYAAAGQSHYGLYAHPAAAPQPSAWSQAMRSPAHMPAMHQSMPMQMSRPASFHAPAAAPHPAARSCRKAPC